MPAERATQSDRLRVIGALAAGAAHELNNPLSYVLGNLELAATELAALGRALDECDARVREHLGAEAVEALGVVSPAAVNKRIAALRESLADASDGAQRVRDIVRDLGTLARPHEELRGPIDPRSIVEATLALCGPGMRRRATVSQALAATPCVAADAAELGQVVLNLLEVAVLSAPPGAREPREVRVASGEDAAGRAVIEVLAAAADEPPPGAAAALAICRGIVEARGGSLEVARGPDRGRAFRVALPPAVAPGASVPPAAPPAPAPPAARPRVLVVDDEPLVRLACARGLDEACDVADAASARAALARIDAGERFDAILCDLVMPEMSGADLHAALAARAPEQAARMVFLSGGAPTPALEAFLARIPNACLVKPVEFAVLRAAVLGVARP